VRCGASRSKTKLGRLQKMGNEAGTINGVQHGVNIEQARELLESLAPKCEVSLVLVGVPQCSRDAKHIMHFKTICSHDVPVPHGKRLDFLVCDSCLASMRKLAAIGEICCAYCRCRMSLLSHVVGSVEPL